MTRLTNHRGQHTAEYAIVFAIVLAAAIGMQPLIKRAIQARVKDAAIAMTATGATAQFTTYNAAGTSQNVDLNHNTQYEPYYTFSQVSQVQQRATSEERSGSGAAAVTHRGELARTLRPTDGVDKTQGADVLKLADEDDQWNDKQVK